MSIASFKQWPKWVKIPLIVIFSLFILLIIIGLVGDMYVRSNKKKIITQITQKVNETVEGNLQIKDVGLTVWKNFPNISVRLEGVTLSDSMIAVHQHPLLDIEETYLSLDLFSLIGGGATQVKKITADQAHIFFFTDENGYTNKYLLKSKKKKETDTTKAGSGVEIDLFSILNSTMTMEDHQKNKRMDFVINKINGAIDYKNDSLFINANTDVIVNQLGFNLAKGSFLKKKEVKGDVHASLDLTKNILTVNEMPLYIDGEKLQFFAEFNMNKELKSPFTIKLKGQKVPYQKAVGWLTETLTGKLNKYIIAEPLDVSTSIIGHMVFRDTPRVQVDFVTEKNTVELLGTTFNDVAFKGMYLNELYKGESHSDENSIVKMEYFKGNVMDVPINAKDVNLINLKKPFLKCEIFADFPATKLNQLMGDDFDFTKGNVKYNLKYNGTLLTNSLVPDNIVGNIDLSNAAFAYRARNLTFPQVEAHMTFNGPDLNLKQVLLRSKGSNLKITGYAKDFLQTFIESPQMAKMNVNVNSDMIDLNEFNTFFVQKRIVKPVVKSSVKPSKPGNLPQTKQIDNRSFADKLNDFLTNCSIDLNMNFTKMRYRKIEANTFDCNAIFSPSGVYIRNLDINGLGGHIVLNGQINQQLDRNPFNFNVKMNNILIDRLFYSFDNFGMDDLTDKNISGNFSATGSFSGRMTADEKIDKNLVNGTLKFDLKNGALKNFEPFVKVSQYVFKKRELDNITFENLSNTLTFKNGKVTIPPMSIKSSALVINAEGVYGFNGGTNIALAIPLRNPQKEKDRLLAGKKERKGDGIVVFLKAISGADGKLQIQMDKEAYTKSADGGQVRED